MHGLLNTLIYMEDLLGSCRPGIIFHSDIIFSIFVRMVNSKFIV